MSAWETLPFSAATCFVLAGVILACILFLAYDAYIHREPTRRPMATDMSRDELKAMRLRKYCERRLRIQVK
jgi:hypothetical protein